MVLTPIEVPLVVPTVPRLTKVLLAINVPIVNANGDKFAVLVALTMESTPNVKLAYAAVLPIRIAVF